MKLYYYEYETTVFRPFFDTEYDLFQGYLLESPLGFLRIDDEDTYCELYGSIKEFENHFKHFQARNFNIVELK